MEMTAWISHAPVSCWRGTMSCLKRAEAPPDFGATAMVLLTTARSLRPAIAQSENVAVLMPSKGGVRELRFRARMHDAP